MSKRLRALAGFALATGLLLTAQPAQAQVESGPWTSVLAVVQRAAARLRNGQRTDFSLTCSTASGVQRAERRYATYCGGTRQFQGTFRITSHGRQPAQSQADVRTPVGPDFMLAVDSGGRLYSVHDGATIAPGGTVGTAVRVNTVHSGSTHRMYINGSLKHTYAARR